MMNEDQMLNPNPYANQGGRGGGHHMLVNQPHPDIHIADIGSNPSHSNMSIPPGTFLYNAPPPVILAPPLFGRSPQNAYCQVCQRCVITSTANEAGSGAYTMGAVILVLGGGLLCCLIPCCVDDCQDVIHSCPACNNFLGRKNYLFN
eukprot:TRINITY_DN6292_c0_g1_i1.p1 TRINITY_DN6292_c0_g1~~TRINITY_DN6292_c0_g1_i1.p1  ORF type:complete len:147 (+),score=21.68 TRINITY_DN6292_c0_g1_i1:168-608(+)